MSDSCFGSRDGPRMWMLTPSIDVGMTFFAGSRSGAKKMSCVGSRKCRPFWCSSRSVAAALPIELIANELASERASVKPLPFFSLRLAVASMIPLSFVAVDTSELRRTCASLSSGFSTKGTMTSPTSTASQSATAKPVMWSWWWWVATSTSRRGGEPAGVTAARSAMTALTTSPMVRETPSTFARPWLCTPQSTSMRHVWSPRLTVTTKQSPKPTLYMRTETVVAAGSVPVPVAAAPVGGGLDDPVEFRRRRHERVAQRLRVLVIGILHEGNDDFAHLDRLPVRDGETGDVVLVVMGGDQHVEAWGRAGRGDRAEIGDDGFDDLPDGARDAVDLCAALAVHAAVDEHPPRLVATAHRHDEAVAETHVVHAHGDGGLRHCRPPARGGDACAGSSAPGRSGRRAPTGSPGRRAVARR